MEVVVLAVHMVSCGMSHLVNAFVHLAHHGLKISAQSL